MHFTVQPGVQLDCDLLGQPFQAVRDLQDCVIALEGRIVARTGQISRKKLKIFANLVQKWISVSQFLNF